MNIHMQEAENSAELSISIMDIGIVGPQLDDRGREAVRFVKSLVKSLYQMEYDPDNFTVRVGNEVVSVDSINEVMCRFKGANILIEATTLGFVEMLLCCRTLKELNFQSVSLVYVEPGDYNNPRRSQLLHKREFDLSDDVPGYKAIPGSTIMLNDKQTQKGVFFLGYEARRLDQALEDFQTILPANCCVVFGVPAFKPGWEMDAFANNIRVLRDKQVKGGVHFCGAENPKAAFGVLTKVRNELAPNERLFVAPIGTKPNGIGAALFVAEFPEVKILYDHPRRRAGRTSSIARWHLFTAHLNYATISL